MNKKKVLFVILLVIMIAIIGVAIYIVNNKSTEQISYNTNTNRKINTGNNMLEIKDNFFIQQTNDMYFNTDDYIGKTIKMEGYIYTYQTTTGTTNYACVRKTPGCCGADGLAGLDIIFEGEYPKVDTWVEIVGVMDKYTVNNETVPVLHVSTMQEKAVGVDFVTN